MRIGITIATDGSCIQQGSFRQGDDTARPGACGFVAVMPDGSKVRTALPRADGLIGAMEVEALLLALEFVAPLQALHPDPVVIKCDSQYAVNGFNDWMKGWKAKGWTKKGGLANADLWKRIDAVAARITIPLTVQWVRAHQVGGDPLNAEVDAMVNECARTQIAVETPSISPVAGKPVHFVRESDLPADMRSAAAPVKSVAMDPEAGEPTKKEILDAIAAAARFIGDSGAQGGAQAQIDRLNAILTRAGRPAAA